MINDSQDFKFSERETFFPLIEIKKIIIKFKTFNYETFVIQLDFTQVFHTFYSRRLECHSRI